MLIIGYERSGTTLLRRIVSMCPELKGDIVHEKAKIFMNLTNRKEAIDRLTFQSTQNGIKLDSMSSIRYGIKLPYTTFKRGKRFIDKFLSLFPDGRIIHIKRDPLYSINSQVSTFKSNPNKCIVDYFNSVPKVMKYIKDRDVYFLKYEDLIEFPRQCVKDIFTWMGADVSFDIIDNIISRKDPWTYGDKTMVGLRYFDSIKDRRKQKLVLKKSHIKKIKFNENNN